MPTSLNTEARAAFLGTLALLRSQRGAGGYFDASPRGLVGSFIALIVATALMIAFFSLGTVQMGAGASPFIMLFTDVVTYGVQMGVAWLAFGIFGTQQRFIHYLCADNWVSAVTVFILILVSIAGAFGGALVLGPSGAETITGIVLVLWLALLGARIWLSINILRLIVGLSWGQLALVILAQGLALFFSLGLLGGMIGV